MSRLFRVTAGRFVSPKTIKMKKLFAVMASGILTGLVSAQEPVTKPKLTVLNIDTRNVNMTSDVAGDLVRIEAEKLGLFEVMDRYDVAYMIEKNQLKISNCYGKICLVEVGQKIGADKMLSGSIELFGETIIMTMRLIDVKTNSIEKTHTREFLNLNRELQKMVVICLNEMFARPNDETIVNSLTKKSQFENILNTPKVTQLKLSGPRMGFTVLTGEHAKIFSAPEYQGGYDGFPAMFQFGYQFEKKYLNEGNFQALFEFIPMVTGLDQGVIIPSFTILHGIRGNKKGWEFAFGPTVSLVQKADGYYDPDNVWHLENEWTDTLNANPYPVISRMDSRGRPALKSGFVFACGRSIRTGKLNIPINLYAIPQKDGFRFGFSFGFNAVK